MTLALQAVPAKPGIWKAIMLKNGTIKRVELRGDEFFSFWRAEDGQKYILDGQGTYVKTDAAMFEQLKQQANERRATRNIERTNRLTRAMEPKKVGTANGAYIGAKSGLVILVDFPDKQFLPKNTKEYYQRIMTESGFSDGKFVRSVKDYFVAQSVGQFELNLDVAGPYRMDNPYSYYGKWVGNDNDHFVGKMITQACQKADADIDFSKYDWDGNGEVEQVYILYAGHGEASWNDSTTVWPHEWSIYAATSKYSDSPALLKLDNVTVDTYATGSELGAIDGEIDGIGTFCHEFSHCLGIPDFYDTGDEGNFGMSYWDLMDAGSYAGDSFRPVGYSIYEKSFCGWKSPIELKDTAVQVRNLKALSEEGDAYIIYNQGNRNEYFLLENRQQTGTDDGLLGHGLLVTHVDYDKNAWQNNTVNTDGNHQRLTIVPADNSFYTKMDNGALALTANELAGDPFPHNSNDSLTNNSKPSNATFNANNDGMKKLNRGVLNIVEHQDGTVSFDYNPISQTITPAGLVFEETFDDCRGTGGNDNIWSGSAGEGTFNPDHADLKYATGGAKGGDRCAKFTKGNGTEAFVTTSTFENNGELTFTFKAAPWSVDKNVTIELDVAMGTATLSQTSFALTNKQWTTCTTTIKGSGQVKIRFKSPQFNRFFLDEIRAQVPSVASSISRTGMVDKAESAPNIPIYNLNGQYLGTSLDALPHGVYITNGKKVVR